ncbi:MAG: hypothetical protein QM500_08740 [Methylococcales bacterium]
MKKLLDILQSNLPSSNDGRSQIHFKLVKTQIAWMAFLGETRLSFYIKYLLGILISPISYWITFLSPLGDKLSELKGLSLFLGWWLYLPGFILPFGFILLTVVIITTGMFLKDFWVCVEVFKKSIF